MEAPIDDDTNRRYEAKASQLRADLKQFEADWASRNEGKKPGRQDIKQNPIIASKYKNYNHVRDVLAGKLPASPVRARKRSTSDNDPSHQTPSKRPKPASTPSRARTFDNPYEAFDTPARQLLFSPAMPTSIGPTPQKNGRILGMFDLLEENAENEPPNGGAAREGRDIHATPSKKSDSEGGDFKLGRTPMSSSKRNRLNAFMTPSKRKSDNPLGAKTPTSISKLQLATPAFLKRAPMPTVDEDGQYLSPPAPLRLPRKPLGRSLSSVVAGLRKLEEDKLDEELEAMHEMENDANPSSIVAKKPLALSRPAEILEPDSQSAAQLLGGFDDEGQYDSPTEEAKGRDGQPLRVYKKKGQKRTTRRVNMKPARAKRPQAPTKDNNTGSETEGEGADEEEEDILETQAEATTKHIDGLADLSSDSDFHDVSDTEKAVKVPEKKKVKKKVAAAAAKEKKKEKKEEGEGKVKKAAKKVNELAHANFKRLKLRNTGTKGGPGFGSRFRRRR